MAGVKAVKVLIARKPVPTGTSAGAALREGLLASTTLPAASVPSAALRSVTPALSPLVLNAALPAGQLLLRPMLVTAAQVTGGLAIPQGMIAVTVDFCLPEAVAGAVQVGSLVAVFDTVVTGGTSQASGQPGCTGTHQEPTGTSVRTRMVLPRAQVLSVGVSSTPQAGTSASASSLGSGSSATSAQSGVMLTLAVSQANAERLIQLTETGLPYLALLTTSSRTAADAGHLLDIRPSATPTPTPTPKPKPNP